MFGFISGISILFHWSIFLCLCQYHAVLIIVALYYNLMSGRLIAPAPLVVLKTSLAVWGLSCFHTSCEIFCSCSVKNAIGNLIQFQHIETVDCVWWHSYFHSIDSSHPGTWNISPSVYVIFFFFSIVF